MPRDLSPNIRRLERLQRRAGRKKVEWLKHVEVEDFLERCEVNNMKKASSDEINFSCPFPGHSHGDERPSAFMNDGSKDAKLTSVWKCQGCGRAGTAISFYAEMEGISKQQASAFLRRTYAPGFRAPKGGTLRAEFELRRAQLERDRDAQGALVRSKTIPEAEAERFRVDWEEYSVGYDDHPDVMYMFNRGFEAGDLQAWDIGYDTDSERITIPVRDEDGALVGFKGRAWRPDAKPKFMILGDTDRTVRKHGERYGYSPYDKSRVVFGVHMWGEQERYVMVEGEIDVITLWKLGIPALSTGSASMSDVQARIIRDHCEEIVLFLDDDNAGETGVWGYFDSDGDYHPGAIHKLEPFIRVRLVGSHRRDPNDYVVRGKSDYVKKLIDNAELSFNLVSPNGVL